MRHLPFSLALVLFALPARAADEAAPNTLTPKAVADGWLLLFDGKTTFGWQIDGEARVEDGVLILGGTRATKATNTTAFDWANTPYSLEMELRWEGKTSPTFLFFGAM